MKITKLRVSSYRGIAALETDIPAAGAIVKGKNGAGKTSVLRSIRAALAAQDIAPDAIKQGSDKAEIIVDLDDHTVRRVITAKGSTLTVEKAGMKASKPMTYLAELLGGAALDPLDLYLAKKAKDRKALVLAALPVTVTREQIEKYAGDFELPIDFDTKGHGLEVIARAHKYFYDERTVANREADEAAREAERLAGEAMQAASAVPPGPIVSSEEAAAALANAERELVGLEARVEEAKASGERVASQRTQIANLRAEADGIVPGDAVDLAASIEAEKEAARIVAELESQLAAARKALLDAQWATNNARAAAEHREREVARVASLRSRADELEGALVAATVAAPSEQGIAAAKAAVATARAAVERATLQATAVAAVETSEKAKTDAAKLQAEADELDAVVKRLANDAPTQLLDGADGIPGLSIDGDEVLLEGKRLDALCGAEQMKFAVEIARRVNARTKILIVDGLERLDPEQMETFVEMATADDWQLLATRVDRGDVVIEAIEPDAHDKAAE